jgi:hypothetical protein
MVIIIITITTLVGVTVIYRHIDEKWRESRIGKTAKEARVEDHVHLLITIVLFFAVVVILFVIIVLLFAVVIFLLLDCTSSQRTASSFMHVDVVSLMPRPP